MAEWRLRGCGPGARGAAEGGPARATGRAGRPWRACPALCGDTPARRDHRRGRLLLRPGPEEIVRRARRGRVGGGSRAARIVGAIHAPPRPPGGVRAGRAGPAVLARRLFAADEPGDGNLRGGDPSRRDVDLVLVGVSRMRQHVVSREWDRRGHRPGEGGERMIRGRRFEGLSPWRGWLTATGAGGMPHPGEGRPAKGARPGRGGHRDRTAARGGAVRRVRWFGSASGGSGRRVRR